VQLGRKALKAPGEAREDWVFIQDIARGVGLTWTAPHPPEIFAEMGQAMPSLANITWDRLKRESSVTYPCYAPDKPGNDIISSEGFPTTSGSGKSLPAEF